MSSGIGRVIHILDLAFYEGVGAGIIFLAEGLIAPFTFDGAKMSSESLPIYFVETSWSYFPICGRSKRSLLLRQHGVR